MEKDKATNIPDGSGNEWTIGADTFTRQEVFKLLYTQRAMIYNDIKTHGNFDNVPVATVAILEDPRTPVF